MRHVCTCTVCPAHDVRLSTAPQARAHYHLHFADEKTKAQRGRVQSRKAGRWQSQDLTPDTWHCKYVTGV